MRRPRLTHLLEGTSAQAILVTAPAGFGKTSLACEWLEQRVDVAWFRATPAAADVAAFSVAIAESMEHLVPNASERLRQRLLVSEPPESAARPLAELLSADITTWPEHALLVVDDYHLVTESSTVEEFMDWLLTLAPRLRVLVTTRRRPRWASARRFLHQEIFEITGRDLAMSDAEAARLLGGRSEESLRRLIERAQGWPALLGLAALSATSEVPDEHVSEQLYRYFAEEVLRSQEPSLQQFLLRASVPRVLTHEVVRDVLGQAHPDEVVMPLVDAGLLQPAAAGELVFHPLLREFLRRKLEAEHAAEVEPLVDAALEHARANGRWDEAFSLAASRESWELVAEVIEEASRSLLRTGHIEMLEKWLDAAPACLAFPAAAIVQADILLRRGRISQASALSLDVAERLPNDSRYYAHAWNVAGWAANAVSNHVLMFECHKRALARADDDQVLTSALYGAATAATELEVDPSAYITKLGMIASHDIDARLRFAVVSAIVARLSGRLSDTESIFQRSMPLMRAAADPTAKTVFLTGAAFYAALDAEYDESRRHGEDAVKICLELGLQFALDCSHLVLGYAYTGQRDIRSARSLIDQVVERARSNADRFAIATCAILEARLALVHGDCSAALKEVLSAEVLAPTASTRGEMLAYRAVLEAATGLADRARYSAALAHETTSCADVHIAAQFANVIAEASRPDSRPHVRAQLAKCLQAASSQGALDVAVVAYRAYPELLRLASDEPTSQAILAPVCVRARDQRLCSAWGLQLPVDPVGQISRLTRREREVLALMATGLTNEQIARRLVLAQSTVKTHVHRILTKLGAKSRLQAILVAGDLDE